MKAGFIGLGTLGRAMAKRLIAENVELVLWNRTREKAQDLGQTVVNKPAEVLSDTEVVFLNLFDSDAVRSVLSGPGGLIEGRLTGHLVIDTSTNHFDAVEQFHETIKSRGGAYLEAPVLGSIVPASAGALTVLAGGDKAAYERALPFLRKIGKEVIYFERPGLAARMKLINNLLLAVFMAAIAEGVSLGEASGVDREKVLQVLGVGSGNSTVLNAKREKLLKEDFSTHFSTALLYKDLNYMQDLARSLKKPLFTGSLVKELYAMAFGKGLGDKDFSAIFSVLKDI